MIPFKLASFKLCLGLLLLNPICGFCQRDVNALTVRPIIQNLHFKISGLTFNNDGSFMVATIDNSPIKKILKIDENLKIDTIFSLKCFSIQFLCMGPDNSLYVSYVIDRGKDNASLLKINSDSTSEVISDGFIQPVGISFDPNDNVYLVDAMLRKVYKISPNNSKTIFIDLDNYPETRNILYHGLTINNENHVLFLAGINLSGGIGNVIMFKLDDEWKIWNSPSIFYIGNCKHLITHKNKVYVTVNSSSLLIKDLFSGKSNLIDHPLLLNGMEISFGGKQVGTETIYVNTHDRIIKLENISQTL